MSTASAAAGRRPQMQSFSHQSFPCRDLEEGKRFYMQVLGGHLRVDQPTFASITIAGADIGIGIVGCAWPERVAEYPHCAFFIDADNLVAMRRLLERCEIPVSPLWTRSGVEALMFFRDPTGNLIELFCRNGYPGAEGLPRSGPAGHGVTVDLERLWYDRWRLPGGEPQGGLGHQRPAVAA
jgi:catechol 2,3-dioxygenase-like lactoylglutathione lyase family enzyme